MNLPLYFISDSHMGLVLDDSEVKRREKLFSVFNKIKQSGGTLIIGGDFFDFWFEFSKRTPTIYKSVLDELSKLKNSGIDIHYVAGNHDYWDFGYFESTFAKSFYKNDLFINNFDSKILITHGDGLLKSDVGYRALKKVIRNKIFIFFFKLFGEKIGYKIGKKVSHTSQGYNHFDNNLQEIKHDINLFAEQQWKEGIDVVLVGHYHQKEIIKKGSKRLIFMGDWLKHYSITKFDGQDWSQFSWNEL